MSRIEIMCRARPQRPFIDLLSGYEGIPSLAIGTQAPSAHFWCSQEVVREGKIPTSILPIIRQVRPFRAASRFRDFADVRVGLFRGKGVAASAPFRVSEAGTKREFARSENSATGPEECRGPYDRGEIPRPQGHKWRVSSQSQLPLREEELPRPPRELEEYPDQRLVL